MPYWSLSVCIKNLNLLVCDWGLMALQLLAPLHMVVLTFTLYISGSTTNENESEYEELIPEVGKTKETVKSGILH